MSERASRLWQNAATRRQAASARGTRGIVLAALAITSSAAMPGPVGAVPFAYITNTKTSSVSVVDTASDTVIATIPVGKSPYGVAVNGTGTRVYTADEEDHTVSVIDTRISSVVATVPVGADPFGVAVDRAGTRVYAANRSSNSLSVIDAASNAVVATVPVGLSPRGVAVHPTGTRVYVVNRCTFNCGTVSVVDASSNAVVATVAVGSQPYGVAVHPTGNRAYVANTHSNTVSVIDTATHQVIATIPVGGAPRGVAFNPAGTRAYVANFKSHTVSVIDTGTHHVVGSVRVGAKPMGLSVNPSGTRVYVANAGSNTVSVISTATNAVLATVQVGEGPRAFGEAIGPPTAPTPIPTVTPMPTPSVTPQIVAIRLSPETASKIVGGPAQNYAARADFSDGRSDILVTQQLVYSASDTGVAVTPNEAPNVAQAFCVGNGAAIITATDPGTGVFATASLACAGGPTTTAATPTPTSTVPAGTPTENPTASTPVATSTPEGSPLATGTPAATVTPVATPLPSASAMPSATPSPDLGACPALPEDGCHHSASTRGAHLRLRSGARPDRSLLLWRWVGESSGRDFGDPTAGQGYTLCLYDGTGVPTSARIAPDADCGRSPCWRRRGRARGFVYRNRGRQPDGISSVQLENVRGKTKISIEGRGIDLQVPTLPLVLPVRVQLLTGEDGWCWENEFSSAAVRRYGDREFLAR